MSFTFGAGTGDDAVVSTMNGFAGSSSAAFVCGWWYPTTLTATRGLWSAGNTVGAEIDTTTSELRLRTDNTTDGQWTTTGAALTVGEWKFLAFLLTTNNTGPAAAWRVWSGTAEVAPVEITVTSAVAPVGNFTAATAWYAGNKGSGALAFQGDIEWVSFICVDASLSASQNVISVAARGAITNDEAENVYRRLVLPHWSGNVLPSHAFGSGNSNGLSTALLMDFGGQGRVAKGGQPGQDPKRTMTINGATLSQNRGPVPIRYQPLYPNARAR